MDISSIQPVRRLKNGYFVSGHADSSRPDRRAGFHSNVVPFYFWRRSIDNGDYLPSRLSPDAELAFISKRVCIGFSWVPSPFARAFNWTFSWHRALEVNPGGEC